MIRPTALGLALLIAPAATSGQDRKVVEQERREFLDWIQSSPVSPLKAVAVRAIGPGITLGPETADIPLAGGSPARLVQDRGRVRFETGATSTAIARGRPVPLTTAWQIVVGGPSGDATVTLFGTRAIAPKRPGWFGYDSTMRLTVALAPSPGSEPVRRLAPDGVEVEATEAGTVSGRLAGAAYSLRVFRMAGTAAEESELEIYFRDPTSGHGTYPSGRFVSLIPTGGNRYVLDFNRARNPFCAYNTVYPCPAPWQGNVLRVPIRAGEKYVE